VVITSHRLSVWSYLLHVAALVVAAAAVGVRWASDPSRFVVVPPGLVLLGVAVVLVLALRRPFTVALATLVAGFVALQLLASGVLDRPSGPMVSAALAVQLLGALVAVVAGLVVLIAQSRSQPRRRPDWARAAQVAGLLVLAPVCAEYLAAYDDSTGDPVRLLGNLSVFVPLYGCPALLIRELARRQHLGWRGIVLLAAAFGLVQAGLVDQSLFSADYREIEGWDESYRATLIAPLGISAFNLLNFVGGHVVFSICAPIALVEGARPARAEEPWLSRPALGVVAALYVGVSALVLNMHLTTESSHASFPQAAVTLLLVACLVLAAVRWGGRPRRTSARRTPRIRTVLAVMLVLALVHGFADETWTGVAMAASALVAAGLLLARWSTTQGWATGHVVAAASPPVLVRALLAFTYDPLVGEVSAIAKYGHNVVMLVIVVVVVACARQRRPAPAERVTSRS
jgi:hypothetical protein